MHMFLLLLLQVLADQQTTRCVASHPVVIVLCTKLDAECDQ